LSPVQDGSNKPQIDSNKANNYKIVKEVGTFSSQCFPKSSSLIYYTLAMLIAAHTAEFPLNAWFCVWCDIDPAESQ